MFDKKSVYALNKMDKSTIVCPSVTGEDIRLSLEDFDNEEEFAFWKAWSDTNYHEAELTGQYETRCFSLDDRCDAVIPSAEEIFFTSYLAEEQAERKHLQLKQIKSCLTETQYRRIWKYYVEKISVTRIARDEGVTEPSISESIKRAKEKISKIFS